MLAQALAWVRRLLGNERGTAAVPPEADAPIGDDVELVDEILGDDAPAGPPAPDVPGAAPAVPAVPPAAGPPAQPRDTQGRFAPKPEGAPAAAPPAPAAVPSAPGQPAAGPPPAAPPAPPGTALDRDHFQAFTYRAGNQDNELPHSYVGAQGVLIANEGVPALRQLVAEAHGYGRQGRRREAELLQELQAARESPDLLKAQAYTRQIQALFAQGPEAVLAWMDDFNNNRARFLATAEQDVLKAQNAALQAQVDAVADEREGAELGPQIGHAIDRTLADLSRQYQGIDRGALRQRLIEHQWDQIVYEIDPAKRQLQEGELAISRSRRGTYYVLNTGTIEREAAYHARIAASRAAPITAAADANAAAIAAARGGPPVPPPPSGVPPIPPGPAELMAPKSRAEFDKLWDDYYRGLREQERSGA